MKKYQSIPVTNKVRVRKLLPSYVVVTRIVAAKKGRGSYSRNLFKKSLD
jgi:stalled ribosome alternative rescue factor ArfA